MATSKAAYLAEKAIGHDDNAVTQQDVSSYPQSGADTMKALVWRGKQKVEIGTCDPCRLVVTVCSPTLNSHTRPSP